MAINENQMVGGTKVDPLLTGAETTTINNGGVTGTLHSDRPINNNRNQQNDFNARKTSIFANELRMSSRVCYVSEGAKKMLSAIDEAGTAGQEKRFVVEQLPSLGYLVFHDKTGIILLFEENLSTYSGDFMPKSRYFNIARDDIAKKYGTSLSVIMTYLITPDMYTTDMAVTKTVKAITKVLMLGINSQLDLLNLANDRFRILNDSREAMRFIAEENPSTVAPYMQYGTSFQVASNDRDVNGSWGANNNNVNPNDLQWKTIFAVGGYTEFLDTGLTVQVLISGVPTNIRKLRPIIVASTAQSAINTIRLLPLIAAVGYDAFIGQQLWKKPFRLAENGKCSLGMLFTDANGKMLEVQNQQDVDTLFNSMANPIFMWESCEGSFEYIGSNAMSAAVLNRDAHLFIKQECAAFLNSKASDGNMIIDAASINDVVVTDNQNLEPIRYTGTVIADGTEIDSRAIDYFAAVATTANPHACENFLSNTIGGCDTHLHDIADIGYTQQNSRYFCRRFIMNAAFVHQMVANIVDNIRVTSNSAAQRTNFFSATTMNEIGNQYGQAVYQPFGMNRQPMYRNTMQYSGWNNLR